MILRRAEKLALPSLGAQMENHIHSRLDLGSVRNQLPTQQPGVHRELHPQPSRTQKSRTYFMFVVFSGIVEPGAFNYEVHPPQAPFQHDLHTQHPRMKQSAANPVVL